MQGTTEGDAVWLCDDTYFGYKRLSDWSLTLTTEPGEGRYYTSWYLGPEGRSLWVQWSKTNSVEDAAISGVLADWLDDHREQLLESAVGPDPAGRLDLLIRWLREVRCWGKESVSA